MKGWCDMGTETDTGDQSRYAQRGVSSSKKGVHEAIVGLDEGLFPGAFCKIFPDDRGDPDMCIVPHADGAGTKAGLAYLYWKTVLDSNPSETEIFEGPVQDSIVMNVDDVACVGVTGPMTMTSSIDRNPFRIPDFVLPSLIQGGEKFCAKLRGLDVGTLVAHVRVGETADVGDLVRTLTVNHSLFTAMRRDEVIDASNVREGGIIVGFSSTGQCAWEDEPNSGIRSNGLTNARHEALSHWYRKFLETYAPEMGNDLAYSGFNMLSDPLPGDWQGFSVGTALLSPTRCYAPLIKRILGEVDRRSIQAFFHNSGGGLTKCIKFGQHGIIYVKDKLPPVPPLFTFLQEVRAMSWKEMCSSYNMGVGLEAVVSDMAAAEQCIDIAYKCGIDAWHIGDVKASEDASIRHVSINAGWGEFNYAS